MKIFYIKSKWEMWDDTLLDFVNRVQKDGFDGTELYFDSVPNSPSEIKRIHQDYNLYLLGQILTEGDSIHKHIDSFKRQADIALNSGSKKINVHAGKDFFSFADNCKLIATINNYSKQSGINFLIETHRGRFTYSLVETIRYLNEFPDIKLTADFSHWMVVHESDLSNQTTDLELAITRSFHIHARVGYEEGPQITDPAAPEWKTHLDNHLKIWRKILLNRKRDGCKFMTITPEFGPPNYMHTTPFNNKPVGDTWRLNLKMRDILINRLHV